MAEQMLWGKCATAARAMALITSILQAGRQWKAMLDLIFDLLAILPEQGEV